MKEKIIRVIDTFIPQFDEDAASYINTRLIKITMAEELEQLVNQEVEKRIAERMPSEEEIDDETIAWAAEHQCGTPFSERWIGFVKGAKWLRSRLTPQVVPQDTPQEQRTEGGE